MGNVGLPELLLIAVVFLLLFGGGKIADIGKGLGQGIKNFKQGLREADQIDGDKSDNKMLVAGQDGASANVVKKTDGEAAPKQA